MYLLPPHFSRSSRVLPSPFDKETYELAERSINDSLMGMTPRPVGMGYGTISAGSKQAPRDEECCLLATIAG